MPEHGEWIDTELFGYGPFVQRHYHNYRDYLAHQRAKFAQIYGTYDDVALSLLPVQESDFRQHLGDRLRWGGFIKHGMSVLCLGARIGTEVAAFYDLGCFAVGIDIEPGPRNLFVLPGDMHDLGMRFPVGCVDVIYTNSLDHIHNPQRLFESIKYTLKPGGLFIAEIVNGSEQGAASGAYESFYWKHIDDVIGVLGMYFEVVSRQAIDYPWVGEHVVMRKV